MSVLTTQRQRAIQPFTLTLRAAIVAGPSHKLVEGTIFVDAVRRIIAALVTARRMRQTHSHLARCAW